MNSTDIPLNLLPLGKKAFVKSLTSNGAIRRRMLDLGLITNTVVEALQKSPSGDPTAYSIRGLKALNGPFYPLSCRPRPASSYAFL